MARNSEGSRAFSIIAKITIVTLPAVQVGIYICSRFLQYKELTSLDTFLALSGMVMSIGAFAPLPRLESFIQKRIKSFAQEELK